MYKTSDVIGLWHSWCSNALLWLTGHCPFHWDLFISLYFHKWVEDWTIELRNRVQNGRSNVELFVIVLFYYISVTSILPNHACNKEYVQQRDGDRHIHYSVCNICKSLRASKLLICHCGSGLLAQHDSLVKSTRAQPTWLTSSQAVDNRMNSDSAWNPFRCNSNWIRSWNFNKNKT